MSKPLAVTCCVTLTLNSSTMELACYQIVIEWVQTGNDMQSVCDNAANNCDKSVKITNLFAST